MKKLSIIYLLALSVGITGTCFAGGKGDEKEEEKKSAESEWNWGDKPMEAKGKWAMLSRNAEIGDYKKASVAAKWLLQNAPQLNEALYIYAAMVYENLERTAASPVKKQTFQDSVLYVYDARMETFGNKAEVLNRKGLVAFYYLTNRKERIDDLYNMYKEILTLNGERTYASNLSCYMYLISLKRRDNTLTDQQVFDVYNKMTEVFEYQLKAYKSDPAQTQQIMSYKENVDKVLASTVKVDCDFVRTNFGPKFETSPDLGTAHKIYNLMGKERCTTDPLFISATEFILAEQPTPELYEMLGKVHKSQEQYAEAIANLEKAVEIQEEAAKKADYLLEIADIYSRQGQKSNARSYARKAAATSGTSASKAYIMIGDLYFNSYKQCTEAGNALQSRLVFIAAYEQYQKAGAMQKMEASKQQFPSMEDLHLRSKNVGDVINTGCWIGENVKLQTRD